MKKESSTEKHKHLASKKSFKRRIIKYQKKAMKLIKERTRIALRCDKYVPKQQKSNKDDAFACLCRPKKYKIFTTKIKDYTKTDLMTQFFSNKKPDELLEILEKYFRKFGTVTVDAFYYKIRVEIGYPSDLKITAKIQQNYEN